jgi:starch-binding outer membrane protein, SusD/RagB family
MKKTIYIVALTAIGLGTLNSCKKELLNPVPETSITDATAFDSPERILNQVRSIYGALKGGAFYGGRYIVYNDIRGEEFANVTTNNITGYDVWQYNPNNTSTSVEGLWGRAYSTINQANLFLDGMAAKGNTVVGSTLAANYNAEAKFIRALSYYSLLQFYAQPHLDGNGSKPGLPLRLTGIKGPGQSDLARSTVAEVYAQILSDLNSAESNLPSDYGTGSGTAVLQTTRAHKNTAIALKTRVYLSMGKYAEVITEANKIVSPTAPFVAPTGVKHALQADITTVFKTPYTTLESILSMPFTNNSADVAGTQNQLGSYFGGEFALVANGIIADPNWNSGDKRRSFLTTTGSGSTSKTWIVGKYPSPSPFLDYAPVIRYAEVLLNLAEAKVRTTNTIDLQAVSLLNAVRNRSDATITYTAASFVTATDLLNAILKERRIEFLGEGLRNIDIMRLGLSLQPRNGVGSPIAPGTVGYVWPIPSSELSYNKMMTDN